MVWVPAAVTVTPTSWITPTPSATITTIFTTTTQPSSTISPTASVTGIADDKTGLSRSDIISIAIGLPTALAALISLCFLFKYKRKVAGFWHRKIGRRKETVAEESSQVMEGARASLGIVTQSLFDSRLDNDGDGGGESEATTAVENGVSEVQSAVPGNYQFGATLAQDENMQQLNCGLLNDGLEVSDGSITNV